MASGRTSRADCVGVWFRSCPTGPILSCTKYDVEYAEGGFFRAVIRVVGNIPMATVAEEFDAGKEVDAPEVWTLNLIKGWTPDTMEIAKTWGNGGGDTGQFLPIAEFKPWKIMSDGAYSSEMRSQFGLSIGVPAPESKNPLVGIVPLLRGQWRRTQTIDLESPAAGQIVAKFLMASTPRRWLDESPFPMVTHENGLPKSYSKRIWGLVLGAPDADIRPLDPNKKIGPFYQARLTYGQVGLDRYKDYVLEWPDTKPVHPCSIMRADEVQKIKDSLPGTLFEPQFKRLIAFAGDAKPANSFPYVKQFLGYLIRAAIAVPTPSHHSLCDIQAQISYMDDLLATQTLMEDERNEIRAKIALICYLFCEQDVTGQATGGHAGLSNMVLARQLWLPAAVALVPDHPMYKKWEDYLTKLMLFRFADNMAPCGTWYEPGTYQEWGYHRLAAGLMGLESMKAPGIDPIFKYHEACMDYYMNTLTPHDSRWNARMIPGYGNSATHYAGPLADFAASLAYHNPKLASNLQWAWIANGCGNDFMLGMSKPWIKPEEPVLKSRYFPGFGVIFRAHVGSPDETYLFFRSGYIWSHWTIDQGNLTMYSKGAALFPPQPYTYFTSPNPGWSQYNDMRFGHMENEFRFGWPDGNVLDCFLGEKAQYAWASTGYPAWYINPGVTPGMGNPPKKIDGVEQKEGQFWWNRQVVFMVGKTPKSPNYFVFHDTITGTGRLAQWLNFDLLGKKENLEQKGKAIYPDQEKRILVRIPEEPGTDNFWIAYPKADGEKSPSVTRLASNVIKIVHSEGTDCILLSPDPDRYEGEDLVLEGCAAVVRLTPDSATFAVLGGTGKSGYKGQIFESAGPFEKTVAINSIEAGSEVVKASSGKKASAEAVPGGVRFIAPDDDCVQLESGTNCIRGFGPFDITISDKEIKGTVDGRMRTLVASLPPGITKPMYLQDGTRWGGGYADTPAPYRGRSDPQYSMAFGVLDGKHTVEIREWESPPLPPK